MSLATVAAIALLGLVLAYWTWVWFAPRSETAARAAVQEAGRAIDPTQTASALFGGARGAVTPKSGGVRLLGVVAASGSRPSYALLRMDASRTVAVLQGADVEPGLRLAEVSVDHVVLERNGARETLAWPEKTGK